MESVMSLKRTGLVILTALTLGVVAPSANADDTPPPQKKISGPFEVVISRRGNPANPPIALAGMLNLNVDPSGTFTGVLTRGKNADGQDLPGLLFRGYDLAPDPNGADSYKVYGQITGRAISILFDLGDEKYIIGTGVSKADLSTSNSDLSFSGGSAVGTDGGDGGDWGAYIGSKPDPMSGSGGGGGTTTTTCTTVSILGIQIYKSCTTTTTNP